MQSAADTQLAPVWLRRSRMTLLDNAHVRRRECKAVICEHARITDKLGLCTRMRCPHCNKEIPDRQIQQEAARIMIKKGPSGDFRQKRQERWGGRAWRSDGRSQRKSIELGAKKISLEFRVQRIRAFARQQRIRCTTK